MSILFRIKIAKKFKIIENNYMRLKELRIKAGFTQEQIANHLNINQRTYSGYEIGKHEPNIETLKKLSLLFHVSIDELLGMETNLINLDSMELNKKETIQSIINMTNSQVLRVEAFIKGMIE